MKELRPGVYRHFKGGLYLLLGQACHSETMEKMVVYQALYGERGWWIRPADMWLEKVEHDGQILSRFTYIAPDEATARALLNEKWKKIRLVSCMARSSRIF